MTWIKREIEGIVLKNSGLRPSLIVTGCRQAGKTSLLRTVFPNAAYVTLDVPMMADEAENSGDSFLGKQSTPLIIDEVQYAPNIFRWLKIKIDENRDKSGMFLLTGSQKFQLMENLTESLAGRCSIIECHSLSAREIEIWKKAPMDAKALLEFMFMGGYPELNARSLDPMMFYSDYLATYLERDVRQIINVKNLRDFDRFMRMCAARSGQLLSLNSFASDLNVSPATVKSWISVLEASNIICLLEPFYKNFGKRIVKTPKLYFLDTGLCCYLLGLRSAEELKNSTFLGPMFETHVLGQIVRHFANKGEKVPVYFYRDQYGHEIDFLISVGEKFILIESKWSENPSPTDTYLAGFEELAGKKNVISKCIVNSRREARVTANNVLIESSVELGFLSVRKSQE